MLPCHTVQSSFPLAHLRWLLSVPPPSYRHALQPPSPPPPTKQKHSAEELFLFLLAQVLHLERQEAAQGCGPLLGGLTPQATFEDCLPLLQKELERMRPEFLRHVVRRSRHLRAAPLGNPGALAAARVLGELRERGTVAAVANLM